MSFLKNIHKAFDTKLNSLTGSVPIAWENSSYTPTKGTAFIRPILIHSPSFLADFDGLQDNRGIYQIDLFYPLENGKGDLLTKMDQIYDHFKIDARLVSEGVTVEIMEIGCSKAFKADEAWFMASLDIHFICYNN